jgi:hypothetical protein
LSAKIKKEGKGKKGMHDGESAFKKIPLTTCAYSTFGAGEKTDIIESLLIHQFKIVTHVQAQVLRLIACCMCRFPSPFDDQLEFIQDQVILHGRKARECRARDGVAPRL